MADHDDRDEQIPARTTGHSHGHSHGHDHGFEGGWEVWRQSSVLRVILGLVSLTFVVTVAGIIALWPSGSGQAEAAENARELGLASQRLDATVQDVETGPCTYSTPDDPRTCHLFTLILEEGPDAGSIVVLPEVDVELDTTVPELEVGDEIIVGHEPSTSFYFYADRERRGPLVLLTVLFAVVVIALGRGRGLTALLAMGATVAVFLFFVAPSVLDGNDPLLVAILAASIIAYIGLYLTHGFSPTTTVALAGTLAALGLTLVLSWVFFELSLFSGLASEEALVLPFVAEGIDLTGLLLGGAVIGALGALDDVTVTQVATVAELKHRNDRLSVGELVASGIRVGREHIASTVNTLLLAYAGASLPLLLLFAVTDQSLGTVANSELIAVEIVRTLCGSIGLVAAVPITTVLAAVVVSGPTGVRTAEVADTAPSSRPPSGSRRETGRTSRPGPTETDDAAAAPQMPEPGRRQEGRPRRRPDWDDFSPRDDLDG